MSGIFKSCNNTELDTVTFILFTKKLKGGKPDIKHITAIKDNNTIFANIPDSCEYVIKNCTGSLQIKLLTMRC